MIKTIAIPKTSSYQLDIPASYIGKKIEILFYSLDEVAEDKKTTPKKTMADFRGILSERDYLSLKEHTDQARKEWNRDI
jgi:hypothetical protein